MTKLTPSYSRGGGGSPGFLTVPELSAAIIVLKICIKHNKGSSQGQMWFLRIVFCAFVMIKSPLRLSSGFGQCPPPLLHSGPEDYAPVFGLRGGEDLPE